MRRADLAVCLHGQLRSFDQTAESIRGFVLEPWSADAFVIASHVGPVASIASTEASLRTRLGPRVASVFIGNDSVVCTQELLQEMLKAPAMDALFLQHHKHSLAADMLNRRSCAPTVFAAERRRGLAFSSYLRMRLDFQLFEELPAHFVLGLQSDEAVVPEGEDYGRKYNTSYTDRFLAGGAAAFAADSALWRSVVNGQPSSALAPHKWIMEIMFKAHLLASGVRVSTAPLAGCILRKDGSCKYLGELAQSRRLVQGLVADRPQLCGAFGHRRCEDEPPFIAPMSAFLVEGKRFCGLHHECSSALRGGGNASRSGAAPSTVPLVVSQGREPPTHTVLGGGGRDRTYGTAGHRADLLERRS
jgi:hypothetical protein